MITALMCGVCGRHVAELIRAGGTKFLVRAKVTTGDPASGQGWDEPVVHVVDLQSGNWPEHFICPHCLSQLDLDLEQARSGRRRLIIHAV